VLGSGSDLTISPDESVTLLNVTEACDVYLCFAMNNWHLTSTGPASKRNTVCRPHRIFTCCEWL